MKIRKKHEYAKRADGKNATGRPAKPIDLEEIKKLSKYMLTDWELAEAMNISARQFREHKKNNPALQESIDSGNAMGSMSLRRKQMAMAMNGDRVMLIWLGKQYLGQRDTLLHGEDKHNPLPDATTQVYNFSSPEEAAAAFEAKLRAEPKLH